MSETNPVLIKNIVISVWHVMNTTSFKFIASRICAYFYEYCIMDLWPLCTLKLSDSDSLSLYLLLYITLLLIYAANTSLWRISKKYSFC